MSDLNGLINDLLGKVSDSFIREAVAKRTEGQTIEERLAYIERQAENSEVNVEVAKQFIFELQTQAREQEKASVDFFTAAVSAVFALAEQVMGRSFTPEEVKDLIRVGIENSDEETPAGFGQHLANAVREKVLS